MCGLTVRTEQTYGVIDAAGTSEYAGTLQTMTTSDTSETEDQLQCGSMVRADVRTVSTATGFSASVHHKRGQGWEKWVERALGALTGIQRTIPSFDALFRVGAQEFHLLTGCKVDTLTISAESIAATLNINVTAVARWHTITPFADSDGSALEMEAAAVPVAPPVTFNIPWSWSSDGQSFEPIKGKSFTLTIARSLQSEPGITAEGADDAYELEAGGDSTPQGAEITLDIVITSVGPEWDRMRLANTKGLTFRTVIDGRTVTLTGCNLSPDGPDRTQSSYDETISVTATDMTVV